MTTIPEQPSNGRVTQGELYKALYSLQEQLAETHRSITRGVDGVVDRVQGIDEKLDRHLADGHPRVNEIQAEQIKLDAKKAGIAAAFLAAIASLGAGALELFRFLLTRSA